MNITDFMIPLLKERDALVAHGLSPAQALKVVAAPVVARELHDVLVQLSKFQRQILNELMRWKSYEIGNAICTPIDMFSTNGRLVFEFTSLNIGQEDFTLELVELPEDFVDDLNSYLKSIVG